MAAYASLVTLARNIDPIHGDFNHMYLYTDLKPLYEKVVQLQTIMENCPGETLSQEFQARIRDFGYRAKRVIDTHYLQVLRWKRGEGCLSLPKFHELTDEASSLILEAQNHQIMQIKELSLVPSSSSSAYAPRGATRKVRLYSDITNLEEKLYEGCSRRQVIPIVGMGGLGKTTLANFLFNESCTQRHFDRRAWITVSQSYERCELLSEILRQFNVSPPEDAQYKDLGATLSRNLKHRRYLIVIDDVWSERLWDDINIHLPDDGIGSRILLTTRLQDVANYVVPSADDSNEKGCIHRIEFMDLDSSWSLLKETVFGQDGGCPVELEGIGKSIAKSCGGLPLAIVVIAGVLSSTNNKKDLWKKIAEDVTTAINSSDGVVKILSLSYIHLPHHLKPCFLYLACFSDDHKIEVSKLIMLWIAEGFLKLNKLKSYDDEKVAYEYLEDLMKKNLVLVSETEYNGKIRRCHLHDMVRDLCVEMARKENFMSQVKDDYESSSAEIKDQIRFNICSEKSFSDVEKIHDDAPIRTIHYSRKLLAKVAYTKVFRTSFHLLQVLDAENIELSKFPCQVMQLFLLWYLALCVLNVASECELKVPSSIKELQYLRVIRFSGALELPSEIWELPKLRHIISIHGTVLPDPPIRTRSSSPSSPLENLQSLNLVENFKVTEQALQMIPNVKTLGIMLFDKYLVYCLRNLVRFAKLETLSIWYPYLSWDNLKLPPCLKELKLSGRDFPWSDIGKVVGSLPNLEVMRLENSHSGDVWKVKEGEFSNLKVLDVTAYDLFTWEYDGETGRIFPNLEELKLNYCKHLREVPRCIGEIDTLRLIRVLRCNELLVEWAREVKEEQESYGNEALQVIIIK